MIKYSHSNLATIDESSAALPTLKKFRTGEFPEHKKHIFKLLSENERLLKTQEHKQIRNIVNKIIKNDDNDNRNLIRGTEPFSPVQSSSNFLPLKMLEGEVVSIDRENEEVLMRFQEIGGDDQVIEEAVFDMKDIYPEDHDLLMEGAIVYWNIGYLDQPEGRQRFSELRFRRLPILSKADIARVKEKAKSFKNYFSPESKNKASGG